MNTIITFAAGILVGTLVGAVAVCLLSANSIAEREQVIWELRKYIHDLTHMGEG
jgi:hypothetical protein